MNATEQSSGSRGPLVDVLPLLGCLGYLALGTIWVCLSDRVGAALFTSTDQLTNFQTFKGVALISLSTVAVYVMLWSTCLMLDRPLLPGQQPQDTERRHSSLTQRSSGAILVGAGNEIEAVQAGSSALSQGGIAGEPTLEARIDQRTGELEAANKALEAFTYSVAHDLSTPVAHAHGFAAALEAAVARGDATNASHYARRIAVNCKLMREIIEGLLKLSRSKRAELERRIIDCDLLVKQVISELDVPAIVRIETQPLGKVYGDSAMLRQVWTNLISNAVKFSARSAQPRVQVRSVADGAEKIFSVADNGVGFDPTHAGKLFGVFERLSTAQEFEGTGIGLSVVKSIVERHGGRVWATGDVGRGATFSFAIPLLRE